jgi:hypothetical protein
MKRWKKSNSIILALLVLVVGCVDPFDPPLSNAEVNFLVVDGFLDSGTKFATVKLSLAVPLDTNVTSNPVRNAIVNVEGDDGTNFVLAETAAGIYTRQSNLIHVGKVYRLRIQANSKEYISDDIQLRAAPSLDSVTWRAEPRGVTVYVDSHDVAGSTRYYQWIYTETWEYNAPMYSNLKFIKETGVVVPRTESELVTTCYDDEMSTKVLVSTTTTNNFDVVNDFPLAFVPTGSAKISRLYSIEVEQRALDEQAYTYWLNLQKTTENLGGLFDPLPSEVTGNMHNVKDASEKVLGYFSGGEIQRRRLFISRDDLPIYLLISPETCNEISIPVGKLTDYIGSDLYITAAVGQPVVTAYLTAAGGCVDCRFRGGRLTRPDFWPPR